MSPTKQSSPDGTFSTLGLGDALVAASAHVYKARLFTLNVKHYPMKDVLLYARSTS